MQITFSPPAKMSKVIKNTAYQLLGSVVSKVIGMFFVIVAGRSLGAEGYGNYSFVFTFTSFFAMMASFGLPIIATRELARRFEDQGLIIGDIIFLKAGLGVLAVALCLIFAKIFGYSADLQLGFRIVCIGLLVSFLDSYRPFFQATLQMQYNMYASMIQDALLLASALYLAYIKAGFIPYVWAGLGCTLTANLFLAFIGGRLVKPRFRFDKVRLTKFMLESFPLGLASFVVYVYYNADTIMLSKLSTMAEVGYYAVAYKFVFLGQVIPQALVNSFFPGFSHDVMHNIKRAEERLELAFRLFCYVAFGMMIVGVLYHQGILNLLFGEKYIKSSGPLLVFSLSFVFMLPNILFSKYLVAAGKQKYIFYAHLASAVLNVTLNLYAIPHFGAIGAAATTLISDIVVFVAFQYKMINVMDKLKASLFNNFDIIIFSVIVIIIGMKSKLFEFIEVIIIIVVYMGYVYFREKRQMNSLLTKINLRN